MWMAEASNEFLPLKLWDSHSNAVLVCGICWGVIYGILRVYLPKPKGYSNQKMNVLTSEVVSLVHSFCSATASILCLSRYSNFHPIWGYDICSAALLVFSTGYLLYDTAFVILNFKSRHDLPFFIHHLVALMIYGYSCLVRQYL
jgi:hypothetical protein